VYTHEDYGCRPFSALGRDGEVHMAFPAGAERLRGPFMHEAGHMFHWYRYPQQTLHCGKHWPDRLEVAAYYLSTRLQRLAPTPDLEQYLALHRDSYFDRDDRICARVARMIDRAFSQEAPFRIVEGILGGDIDVEALDRGA